MKRETIPVTGMSCASCERSVENALGALDRVTRVDADHEGDAVEVVAEDDVERDDLHAAIEAAGYGVTA